jgi:hypothetical protein
MQIKMFSFHDHEKLILTCRHTTLKLIIGRKDGVEWSLVSYSA